MEHKLHLFLKRCLFAVCVMYTHICVCASLHTCMWWPGVTISNVFFFLLFLLNEMKSSHLSLKLTNQLDLIASGLWGSACLSIVS